MDVTSAQVANGLSVYKDKTNGRETARLAIDGSGLPLPDGQLLYAAVVPDDDTQAVRHSNYGCTLQQPWYTQLLS